MNYAAEFRKPRDVQRVVRHLSKGETTVRTVPFDDVTVTAAEISLL
jgi:hypothetical protein